MSNKKDVKVSKGQTDKLSESAPQETDSRDTAAGEEGTGESALTEEARRLEALAAAQVGSQQPTERLSSEMMSQLPLSVQAAFGTDVGGTRWYRKLPLTMGTAELPADVPRWRIELEGLGPGVEPLGLDILGDAVVGRGRVGTQPADLDLDQFGALEQGVSRRHALLRPTANHLYVIDLGSTNGTMHNGLPLGPGIARSLKNNDALTFGRMSATVKIIDGPGLHRATEQQSSADDSEITRPFAPPPAEAMNPNSATGDIDTSRQKPVED